MDNQNLLIAAKIVHITTVIFFVGCVWFRTFIVPVLKKKFDKEVYRQIDMTLAKGSRRFGVFNVFILLSSGSYLFYHYHSEANIMLHIKAAIGLTVIVIFYLAPFFVHKLTKKFPSFKQNFHLFLFVIMMVLVVMSQLLFSGIL